MSETGEGVKLHSYSHRLFAILRYRKVYLFFLALDSTIYLSIDLCNSSLYWVVIHTVSTLLFQWFQVWPLGTLSAGSYDFATCSDTFHFLGTHWISATPNTALSSCVVPGPILESVISSWIPDSFYWRTVLAPRVHITFYNCQLNTKYWRISIKLWNWLSVESYSVTARSALCGWRRLPVDHLVLFSDSSPAYAEECEDSDGQGLCIHHVTCEWQRQNWKWYFLAHSLLSSQHFAFLRDISKRLDSKHYRYFFCCSLNKSTKTICFHQYSCLENPVDRGPGRPPSIVPQKAGRDWRNLAQHPCMLAMCGS